MGRRRVLLLLLVGVLLSQLLSTVQGKKSSNPTSSKHRPSCLQLVSQTQPDWEWLQATSRPGSRPLPSTAGPPLAAFDWPLGQQGDYNTWIQPYCKHELYHEFTYRLKLWKGTLYTDVRPDKVGPMGEGKMIAEMLLLAKWLYKDFPDDLDLLVNHSDEPVDCTTPLPFLQSTILDPKFITANQEVNISHLVWPHKGFETDAVTYSHGFTMPYRDAWRDLSISPKQLREYRECVQVHHSGGVPTTCTKDAMPYSRKLQGPQSGTDPWAAARKPQMFWRGGATGFARGWAGHLAADPQQNINPLARMLWNKRIYLSILARPYEWMDVGLTSFHTWTMKFSSPELTKLLRGLVGTKPPLDLEEQTRYQLGLSIDGYSAPWRLPRQMLGMVPVLKVESPYKEWFADHMQPHVHYQPIRYDLADLVTSSKALLEEAAADSHRLQCMAYKASEMIVDQVNGLAQLDAFVWSILKLKEAYNWEVRSPSEEKGAISWRTYKVSGWMTNGFRHVKKEVQQAFPNNYKEAKRETSQERARNRAG